METKNDKKEQNLTFLSKIFIFIAGILLLFSFIAPIIFTNNSSKWDFSGTGEIGDTIGGIMNPFIAIGGVIMTFLAFYMQVQANKLQREQFFKSLNKNNIDEKIDSFYKLNLISLDIDNTIKDVDKRVAIIEKYIKEVQSKPFQLNLVKRYTLKHYDRVANIERLSIYKGFKLFLSNDKDWITNFSTLYNVIDYIPEAFKEIYTIIDNHNNDIYKDKLDIRNKLIELEKNSVNLLNKNINNKNVTHADALLKKLLEDYREEAQRNNVEANLKNIMNLLEKFSDDLILEFNKTGYSHDFTNIIDETSQIIIQMNFIIQKTEHIVSALSMFVDITKKNEESTLNRLKNISDYIKKPLKDFNIESMQEEYNIIPNYFK
jgi:hypothetical protein